jgi:uncharacterized protein (TIGR03905 family)
MPATVANFQYPTHGACCTRIAVSLDHGIIKDIEVVDGCDGNHRGLRSLVRGRPASEVIALLKGTPCDGSATGTTSCPDQLALALEAALK